MQRRSVVLPQPEGQQRDDLPLRHVERTAVEHGERAETLADAGDAQHRRRRRGRLGLGLDLRRDLHRAHPANMRSKVSTVWPRSGAIAGQSSEVMLARSSDVAGTKGRADSGVSTPWRTVPK